MRLPGQIDVKNLVTTLITAAIIGASTYVWHRLSEDRDQFVAIDKRLTRMEDVLEQALKLKPKR